MTVAVPPCGVSLVGHTLRGGNTPVFKKRRGKSTREKKKTRLIILRVASLGRDAQNDGAVSKVVNRLGS